MRTQYTEVPPEAPKPKIWKSLGHVLHGLEVHYGLDSYDGDLDVDREAELRHETANCARVLLENEQPVDGMHLVTEIQMTRYVTPSFSYGSALFASPSMPVSAQRQVMVRFCACDCASRPAMMRCS